ncbi:MAG: LysR family transcriptional regulator [Flavobacteriales bacterium]|nr:LysR family transcriptional regulator [Flavobacteriales bacterium]MBT6916969.1 LysR family transcriptional regulator [Flavobacteriales bacterium]MBT7750527.1 LysR family transcriptional regulator [Flavobacteriales bacterium]
MSESSFTVKSRLWMVSQKGPYLGEGRVQLLSAIDELGSISKAARSMNMSYLKAWKLIHSMNDVANDPLVLCSSGGKGGGGANLTMAGKRAIVLYQKLSTRCQEFLDTVLEELNRGFNDEVDQVAQQNQFNED